MSIERVTWNEFRGKGLLWFVNRILHAFGYCIVISQDTDTGEIKECFPAKTNWRGFPREDENEGYENPHNHLKEFGQYEIDEWAVEKEGLRSK